MFRKYLVTLVLGAAAWTGCGGELESDLLNDELISSEEELRAIWGREPARKVSTPDSIAVLRTVRAGRHETFDRAVFEFAAGKVPAHTVRFGPRPTDCGTGDRIPVEGSAWMDVTFQATDAHTDRGEPTFPWRERNFAYPVIRELNVTCDFEAQTSIAVGLATARVFRVFELRSPARLVVDVRH